MRLRSELGPPLRYACAMADDKATAGKRIREAVTEVIALRRTISADPIACQDRLLVRAWQADRLARTHADLLAHARYRPAAQFFLSDLYGPKDFTARDEAVAKVVPVMTRMLPARALETLALAIELDGISENLDLAIARRLRRRHAAAHVLEIDEAVYAEAYRAGDRAARERQIGLVGRIGRTLDDLARKPLIAGAVKLMEGPAHAAGFGELHDFLARGFEAFRGMRGADTFLATIERRERAINDRLFSAEADPFELPGEARV